jgi:hypothetical protein
MFAKKVTENVVTTQHLKKIRQRTSGTDPIIAARVRRWALIGLLVFLVAGTVSLLLWGAGIGAPSVAWEPV